MCLAGEAPDLDVLANLKGGVFGFAHHRGFTHSFAGLIFPSALVVAVLYLIWILRGRRVTDPERPPRWGLLFVFAYIAGVSHILLDYTNNYGIRPFWPFSERWFSWDIVFIIEPALWLILVVGLLAPSLFALVGQEVGARSPKFKGRLASVLALTAMAMVWAVRDYEHRRAIATLEATQYQGANPVRVIASPLWANPFDWNGVLETANFFATVPVTTLNPEVDPTGQMQIRYKPEETPVTIAAKKSYLGRVYLDWARFPVTETERLADGGYVVRFRDLRFDYLQLRGRRTPLQATVQLDRELNVVAESMGK